MEWRDYLRGLLKYMSRIGKNPIKIPNDINVDLNNQNIVVSGPKGSLDFSFHKLMIVTKQNDTLIVDRPSDEKFYKSLHGTTRQLIQNMIIGVSVGFVKELELIPANWNANFLFSNIPKILFMGLLHFWSLYAHLIDFFHFMEERIKGISKLKISLKLFCLIFFI